MQQTNPQFNEVRWKIQAATLTSKLLKDYCVDDDRQEPNLG